MIVETDFLDHWKTRLLVDALDGDETAPLLVLRLWAHCQNRKQWVFTGFTDAALKALCRYSGHANKLMSSLTASGFVRREGDSLIVCGWDDYNASLVASWENGKKGGRPSKPKPKENPPDKPDKTHGLPMGYPSETDKIREDKIREDKKEDSKSSPKVHWEPTGGFSGISQEDIEEWKEAYPACDIQRQLSAMNQWLKSNPAKAKKKLWRKFVTNWLGRSQESGGDMKSGYTPQQSHHSTGQASWLPENWPELWEKQFDQSPEANYRDNEAAERIDFERRHRK